MLISKSRLILIASAVAVAAVVSWQLRDSLKPGSLEPLPVPGTQAAPPPPGQPVSPRPAGPRPVALRDGTSRDLAKAPGKLLIVHFWATWCAPCVEELPGLLEYSRSLKDDPTVEVLAVSVDTDWKTVDDFLKKTKATGLPVALDPQRAAATAFGTEKFPETWFLDPNGKVIEGFIGPVNWADPETLKVVARLREMVKMALPDRAVGQ